MSVFCNDISLLENICYIIYLKLFNNDISLLENICYISYLELLTENPIYFAILDEGRMS